MKYFATIENKVYEIEVDKDGTVVVDGVAYDVEERQIDGKRSSLSIGNRSLEVVAVESGAGEYEIVVPGEQHNVLIQDELTYRVAQAQAAGDTNKGKNEIKAAMPGTVIAVKVAVGDTVTQGQTLVVLESMKMENELKSPRDGVVGVVKVEAGSAVKKNALLIVLSD